MRKLQADLADIKSKAQQQRRAPDYSNGLPSSEDAERMVLGCILAHRADFGEVERTISVEASDSRKAQDAFFFG